VHNLQRTRHGNKDAIAWTWYVHLVFRTLWRLQWYRWGDRWKKQMQVLQRKKSHEGEENNWSWNWQGRTKQLIVYFPWRGWWVPRSRARWRCYYSVGAATQAIQKKGCWSFDWTWNNTPLGIDRCWLLNYSFRWLKNQNLKQTRRSYQTGWYQNSNWKGSTVS